MIQLGISQAQNQFTKLLNQTVLIIDKKTQTKKAMILPYAEYEALLKKATSKEDLAKGGFASFTGSLSETFVTDDARYKAIVK
ncbi:MAG: hypothetical protein KU37_03335 [Sulfuricurvum sp. PC08-66]|nr:MAG: hypothetical protein KU37_03335 [Sulfuricurvum sp. PC08-66]